MVYILSNYSTRTNEFKSENGACSEWTKCYWL